MNTRKLLMSSALVLSAGLLAFPAAAHDRHGHHSHDHGHVHHDHGDRYYCDDHHSWHWSHDGEADGFHMSYSHYDAHYHGRDHSHSHYTYTYSERHNHHYREGGVKVRTNVKPKVRVNLGLF